MMVTAVQIANIIHARAVLGALVVVAVLVVMLVAAIASSGAAGCSSGLLRHSYQCCRTTVQIRRVCKWPTSTVLRQPPATKTNVMLGTKSRNEKDQSKPSKLRLH